MPLKQNASIMDGKVSLSLDTTLSAGSEIVTAIEAKNETDRVAMAAIAVGARRFQLSIPAKTLTARRLTITGGDLRLLETTELSLRMV